MLQNLYIRSFLLIDQLEIDFSNGLNVITGSTGAGKSILLKAILFCLGRKAITNPVKAGDDHCLIICSFKPNKLIERFLEKHELYSEPNLIIRCSQNKKNRKKFFVNDQPVTSKLMNSLFVQLIEIHGQHNHTLLLDKNAHLAILDNYADLTTEKKELKTIYQNWQINLKKIAEFQQNKATIEQEKAYLQHICQEIRQANLQIGEEEELVKKKKLLQNRDSNLKLLKDIIEEIDYSNFTQIIAKSQRNLPKLNTNKLLIPDLEEIENNFDLIYDKIEETKQILEKITYSLQQDDTCLEEIDDRLHEIRDLARKHRLTVSEMNSFLQESEIKQQKLTQQISDNTTLVKQTANYASNYQQLAMSISNKRQQAATKLEHKVREELATLEMQKAIFSINIVTEQNTAKEYGIDQVKFLASTNPGTDLAEIEKIASGGELSRFMLSLRVALFDNAEKCTIIFDEIDVGISGHVAEAMGQRIKSLSKVVQIIVVTHQPQVAGKADRHILVAKSQNQHDTNISIKLLNKNEKIKEIARMISGKNITEASIKAAEELILE